MIQLLPRADHVVREAVPRVLDAAGLPAHASTLRSMAPFGDVHAAARAVSELDRMSRSLIALSRKLRALSDVLFWCEAVVFHAACYDAGGFHFCVRSLRRDAEALLASTYVH